MSATVYEGMFILDSNQFVRDPEAVAGQAEAIIRNAGGEILVSRLWEERRLAYPIKGQRKGTYWLTYFRLDSQQLDGILRKCLITDVILRQLFLKVDPRIVEPLVAHALSATPTAPAETTGETRSGERRGRDNRAPRDDVDDGADSDDGDDSEE